MGADMGDDLSQQAADMMASFLRGRADRLASLMEDGGKAAVGGTVRMGARGAYRAATHPYRAYKSRREAALARTAREIAEGAEGIDPYALADGETRSLSERAQVSRSGERVVYTVDLSDLICRDAEADAEAPEAGAPEADVRGQDAPGQGAETPATGAETPGAAARAAEEPELVASVPDAPAPEATEPARRQADAETFAVLAEQLRRQLATFGIGEDMCAVDVETDGRATFVYDIEDHGAVASALERVRSTWESAPLGTEGFVTEVYDASLFDAGRADAGEGGRGEPTKGRRAEGGSRGERARTADEVAAHMQRSLRAAGAPSAHVHRRVGTDQVALMYEPADADAVVRWFNAERARLEGRAGSASRNARRPSVHARAFGQGRGADRGGKGASFESRMARALASKSDPRGVRPSLSERARTSSRTDEVRRPPRTRGARGGE